MAGEEEWARRIVEKELGSFMGEHQAAVYADVLAARGEVARKLAEHARGALQHYARYEDLGRTVKRLKPAEPTPENMPAARVTNVFAGLHTTQTGPARGHVEEILGYLAGLGGGEEGADDAA